MHLDRRCTLAGRTMTGTLIRHSDRGAQYVSIRYSEKLAEAGIEPSVDSRGDSYNNALTEAINGLYKAERSHRRAAVENARVCRIGDAEMGSLVQLSSADGTARIYPARRS